MSPTSGACKNCAWYSDEPTYGSACVATHGSCSGFRTELRQRELTNGAQGLRPELSHLRIPVPQSDRK